MGLLIILATATFLYTKIKARLKLCYVKAEMHLDDFILQKLPRDIHISFPSRRLCRLNVLKGEKKAFSLKECSNFLQVSSVMSCVY